MAQITVQGDNGVSAVVTPATPAQITVNGQLRGPMGNPGAQGATGPAGATGAPGSTWYEGIGAPATTHNDGDYYLDISTGDVYKQVTGSWGAKIGNIKGPAGATGATGATGGTVPITVSATAPASPSVNDLWIDIS